MRLIDLWTEIEKLRAQDWGNSTCEREVMEELLYEAREEVEAWLTPAEFEELKRKEVRDGVDAD